MYKPCAIRVLGTLALFIFYFSSFSQTNFTDKIGEWKKQFPKEDIVAATYKEVIDFYLNPAAKTGEAKVKASVTNEITLVPVKDFLKYNDGVFYYDELAIENLKVMNAEGKEVKVEKLCGTYNEENIFHSDLKVCSVKFPLGERGKPYKYSYTENYRDIKFLTSFYFNQGIPAAERIVQFNVPAWMEIDLREFNFAGQGVEKTSVKEGDITKITFRLKDAQAYTREPSSPNHAGT